MKLTLRVIALAAALSQELEPQVEALIRAASIDFRIGGDRAFYVPALDYVQVPPPQAYFEPINWHRTALHELGHATGHPSRLNRDFSGSFGSKKYAFEELVAEINAAFCCASLGITPTNLRAVVFRNPIKDLIDISAPSLKGQLHQLAVGQNPAL